MRGTESSVPLFFAGIFVATSVCGCLLLVGGVAVIWWLGWFAQGAFGPAGKPAPQFTLFCGHSRSCYEVVLLLWRDKMNVSFLCFGVGCWARRVGETSAIQKS